MRQPALHLRTFTRSSRRGSPLACAALIALALLLTASPAAAATRTVRVGVYENEPKVYTSSDGRPSGIFVDLLEAMAKEEGWALTYVHGTWEEDLKALEDGRIDLMPDVAFSEERAKKYDFHTTPVVESWSYVYAGPNARVDRISQLNGKRVAVLRGSIQETVFTQMVRGFGYEITVVPVDSLAEAFRRASDGEADAAIANYLFGDYFYQEYGLTKTPIVFNAVPLFYSTGKGRNADLLAAVDKHLNAWIAAPSSVYYQTLSKYATPAPISTVPAYVFSAIAIILGLLVVSASLALVMRWQVAVKTQHLVKANEDLRKAYDATIEGWSIALDMRDGETLGHSLRVTERALALARAMGVEEPDLTNMRWGGLLHDIGKLAVPDAILLKPGALTDEEWVVMRQHPDYAHHMLSAIGYLQDALDIPQFHHEKWDGTGYPMGLSGESIPQAARIFAVVDVWDALLSDRPYRPSWAEDAARQYVTAQAGSHFDPAVVDAFIRLIVDVDEESPS